MGNRIGILGMRILLCVAVLASVLPPTMPPADSGLAGWRLVLAWVGTGWLCVSLLLGTGVRQHLGRRRRAVLSVNMAVATTMISMAAPLPSTQWVPFVGIGFAAIGGLELLGSAAAAALPLLALILQSWTLGHSGVSLAINGVAAVAVFLLLYGRVRQREIEELNRAQQKVIELERARLDADQRQREVAGQLHDVLAHTLSGLVITLQGASLAARTEGVSADLSHRLSMATSLAKDGLGEAREAVESLHPGVPHAAPLLGEWLQTTIDRLGSSAGLTVRVQGSPAAVPAAWTELVRSMLMECLTNSLRHAVGAPVLITFAAGSPMSISVLSQGDPTAFRDRGHDSGGQGLALLGSRAAARGARLHSGPTEAGFEVSLELPDDGLVGRGVNDRQEGGR